MNITEPNNIEGAYVCSGATPEDIKFFSNIDWWIQGVLQFSLCIIGLLGNSIAIPILCTKELNFVFYRLLVFLAVFDNMYLTCALLECLRSKLSVFWDQYYHSVLHAQLLYPIHNIVLCCSVYITAGIACERYFAVYKPIQYYNRIVNNGHSPWFRSCLFYALPVVIFCTLVNIPKFFELKAVKNSSNEILIVPTDLRLNNSYIVYYHHYTRLIVTGLIPFFSLVYCNIMIYRAVMRKRHAKNSGILNNSNCSSTNRSNVFSMSSTIYTDVESRQAIILILIILLFLISNSPRLFLTIMETFSVKEFKEDYLHNCSGVSLWILFTASFSHILLTFNSSINFFIYCFTSSSFRNVAKTLLDNKLQKLKKLFRKEESRDEIRLRRLQLQREKRTRQVAESVQQVGVSIADPKFKSNASVDKLPPQTCDSILPFCGETEIDENGLFVTSL